MFFPQQYWWDECRWSVPDGVKFLCERWWELLKDWHCISTYALPCGYSLSVLEDIADVIDDLQEGRLRSCHQLDSLKDELVELLRTDQVLRKTFPSEITSTIARFDDLYRSVPPDPQNRFAELKKRKTECQRAASAARRLHHRWLRRRMAEPDMTWTGIGGILAAELVNEVALTTPNYARIERLAIALLLDCVYRGYNVDYLTSLLDRYVPHAKDLRDGLLHVFRRLHSLLRHRYKILFVLAGAESAEIKPSDLKLQIPDPRDLAAFKVASLADASTSEGDDRPGPSGEAVAGEEEFGESEIDADEADRVEEFKKQCRGSSLIISVEWSQDPDAGAAAEGARKGLQEIVDFLDFQSPTQRYELQPLALVTWKAKDGNVFARLYPDTSGDQPPSPDHELTINPVWAGRLQGLTEALRWSAVARRERTPEVALLATWFGFEYLAGTLERTPIEGIMDYFPKALAIGYVRRRLLYWWRCIQGSPAFDTHPSQQALTDRVTFRGRAPNLQAIVEVLRDAVGAAPSCDGQAVLEIASQSVLLRERTFAEGRLFSNDQLLAQTLQEDAKEIARELRRFLVIRNKLVHRARIDHPLLVVVSERAKIRLYDLLRDISAQLTSERLVGSVDEVLTDYRDTFHELLADLGAGGVSASMLVNRLMLS